MPTHACRAGGWPCGQYRESATWSGSLAGHCSGCGEIFTADSFDLHRRADSCVDPAKILTKKGGPRFERVPKPGWTPGLIWRRVRVAQFPHDSP